MNFSYSLSLKDCIPKEEAQGPHRSPEQKEALELPQNILKTYTLSQNSASITFLLNISINISIIMNIFVPKLRLSNRTEKVKIFSHENSPLLLRVSIHSLKQKGYVDFALQTNENARIITLKNGAMCSEYFRKDEM